VETAVTEERLRIARALHDVIGHGISVMTLHAGGVRRLLRPEQFEERAPLEAAEQAGREAQRLLGVLTQKPVATRIVVLTTFDVDSHVYDALHAGASGFLLKTAPPEDLVRAIRVVAAGAGLLDPAVTRRVIEEFARHPDQSEASVGRARLIEQRLHHKAAREGGGRRDQVVGVSGRRQLAAPLRSLHARAQHRPPPHIACVWLARTGRSHRWTGRRIGGVPVAIGDVVAEVHATVQADTGYSREVSGRGNVTGGAGGGARQVSEVCRYLEAMGRPRKATTPPGPSPHWG
jgi:DNA-binding NarL/FixJ family response regulator